MILYNDCTQTSIEVSTKQFYLEFLQPKTFRFHNEAGHFDIDLLLMSWLPNIHAIKFDRRHLTVLLHTTNNEIVNIDLGDAYATEWFFDYFESIVKTCK